MCGLVTHTDMETPEAAFVTMIMERLREVEEHNAVLLRQHVLMQSSIQNMRDALLWTLHVVPVERYMKFSDDVGIVWRLGDAPCMKKVWSNPVKPLDEPHDNATMFFGRKTLIFARRPAHVRGTEVYKSVQLGAVGEKTTFGNFWRRVNEIVCNEAANDKCVCTRGRQYLGLDNLTIHEHRLTMSVSYEEIP